MTNQTEVEKKKERIVIAVFFAMFVLIFIIMWMYPSYAILFVATPSIAIAVKISKIFPCLGGEFVIGLILTALIIVFLSVMLGRLLIRRKIIYLILVIIYLLLHIVSFRFLPSFR